MMVEEPAIISQPLGGDGRFVNPPPSTVVAAVVVKYCDESSCMSTDRLTDSTYELQLTICTGAVTTFLFWIF